MTPVKSSTIETIGFEPATKTLKIKFKSGDTYHFEGVSADHHAKLVSAESVGKHFHKHIKGSFKATKQEPRHGR